MGGGRGGHEGQHRWYRRRWDAETLGIHYQYDGKDSPITGANPEGDTVARTRVDARTVRSVTKKGGKVTITQTSVVAPDGKTRTVTTTGVNAGGPKGQQHRRVPEAVAGALATGAGSACNESRHQPSGAARVSSASTSRTALRARERRRDHGSPLRPLGGLLGAAARGGGRPGRRPPPAFSEVALS